MISFNKNQLNLTLYAITDRSWLGPEETLADQVEAAILGGATIVQLREKGEENIDLAKSVQKVCQAYQVPFIINDNVKLAKELDADGVHVGASDMAVDQARQILGPDKIIGATAKTLEQARAAEAAGADYLGSGAVFGSSTKKDALPMSKELLTSICQSVSIPVVAIGGIEAENIDQLKGLPIAGVAVVSGIFAQENKTAAALRLRERLYGRPVVQCITNHVTINDVANIILSAKASPIMAHHVEEVEEIQARASALLLNLGATDDYEAMKLSAAVAKQYNHPIVIDPVGVGASNFRRNQFKELVKIASPSVIRGNYSEVKALLTMDGTISGLESKADEDLKQYELYTKALAKKYNCLVVASGKIDLITDGETIAYVESGHAMQRDLTGSGCMLSGLVAAMISHGNRWSLPLVAYACKAMGDTAKEAAENTIKNELGIASFKTKWMDFIYRLWYYN